LPSQDFLKIGKTAAHLGAGEFGTHTSLTYSTKKLNKKCKKRKINSKLINSQRVTVEGHEHFLAQSNDVNFQDAK